MWSNKNKIKSPPKLNLYDEKQKINKLMDVYKIKNFLKRNFDKNYKNK